jgi:putative hydrolase of the HAD superfamily
MIRNAITAERQPARRAVKAVIFGLDDTLYSEREYIMSGFRAVARYVHNIYGVDILNDLIEVYQAGEHADVVGCTLRRRFKSVEENVIRNVIHVLLGHQPRIRLFQDAKLALALLSRKHIMMAAVTVGQSGAQRRKVEALGLDTWLDTITHTAELLASSELDQALPDAFAITGLLLNVDPQEMIFVGDNPMVDFAIPKRMGIATVRIRRAQGSHFSDEAPSNAHKPDLTLPSLDMLVEYLDSSRWPNSIRSGQNDSAV